MGSHDLSLIWSLSWLYVIVIPTGRYTDNLREALFCFPKRQRMISLGLCTGYSLYLGHSSPDMHKAPSPLNYSYSSYDLLHPETLKIPRFFGICTYIHDCGLFMLGPPFSCWLACCPALYPPPSSRAYLGLLIVLGLHSSCVHCDLGIMFLLFYALT